MPRIERYILRQALSSFLLGLLVLTLIVWITQALRELDVVTAQGQALWMFLSLTSLALPQLVVAIVPVALFVACLFTLNRLNADSELVVMSSSGMAPLTIARPFIVLAVIATILSGVLSLYLAPLSLQSFRVLLTQVRADVISSVLKEGQFTRLEQGVTLHIRERGSDGALQGLLIEDRREPEAQVVYVADTARLAEIEAGSFLVMRDGTIQRREGAADTVTTIDFDSYAIDLSVMTARDDTVYFKARERSTADLLAPDETDPLFERNIGKVRAELHERFVTPLYPMAFVAVVLALMGYARSNRQSRVGAVLLGIAMIVGLQVAKFGAASLAISTGAAVPLMYAVPILAVVVAVWVMRGGRLPQAISRPVTRAVSATVDLAERIQVRVTQRSVPA